MRLGKVLIVWGALAVVLAAVPASGQAAWSATGPGGAVVVTGDGDDDYVEGNIYLSGSMTWNVFNTNGENHGAMSNGCSANGAQLWTCTGVASMTFNSGGGADDIRISKEAGNAVPFAADLGPGDDSIRGLHGVGPAELDGGTGSDLWRIQNSSSDVWDIDLAAGTADGSASAAFADLAGIEKLTVDSGPAPPAAGHVLKGNGEPNNIDAPGSNDTIDGRAGVDTIFARGGDDVITGGAGGDQIDCGLGTDTVIDEDPGDNLVGCEITGAPPIEVNVNTDQADLDLDDGNCDVDEEEAGDQCTLRAALQIANQQTGSDEINFDIEPAGQATILPQTDLPTITEGVEIHGATQPGTPVGEPGVFIDGSEVESPKRGTFGGRGMMNVSSGAGTMLERMGFVNGLSTAISVQLDAQLTDINGVFVGLTQMFSAGMLAPNALDGIRVEGLDTLIRDSVISGNGRYGVWFTKTASLSRLINNTIGPLGPSSGLPAGVGPVTNAEAGVAITDGAKENVIGGNTLAEGNEIGRNGVGVLLDDAGKGNDIFSNAIGATHDDGAATELLANDGAGVSVVDSLMKPGQENEIATNTIANNEGHGIEVTDSTGLAVTGNAIGALISDTDCTHVLIDNELRPIEAETAKALLDDKAPARAKAAIGFGGFTLGGQAGEMLDRLGANLICDENGDPIGLSGAVGALIDSNVGDVGYVLENLEGMFRDNLVTSSEGAGVELGKGTTMELLGNLFEDLGGRPIEFDKLPIQIPPDPLDADKGPNGLQNYGYVASYQETVDEARSLMVLWGAKDQKYRLDYYGAENCTPEGQGDVAGYYGSESFKTGDTGYATQAYEQLPQIQQQYAMATVTELGPGYDPTSELSPCIPVTPEGEPGFGLVPTSPYVKQRKVSALADCTGGADCTGEAQITSPDGNTTYGTAELDVAADDDEKVKIKISGALDRMIKQQKKVDVLLEYTTGDTRTTPLLLRAK